MLVTVGSRVEVLILEMGLSRTEFASVKMNDVNRV